MTPDSAIQLLRNTVRRKHFSLVSRKQLFPGWRMSVEQHGKYFRLLDQAARAAGKRTAVEREELRQLIHLRAFGGHKSAKEINHLKDFDDFKAACLAVIHPSDLDAQMRQAEMGKTRLIYAIRELAPEAYIIAEAERKFGSSDWESLDESDLTMLRNHITARAAKIRWPEQSPHAAMAAAGDPDWKV